MKKLFLSAVAAMLAVTAFSQTYKFNVKQAAVYVVDGFSEINEITSNVTPYIEYVNKRYIVNLDKKTVTFYLDGSLFDTFPIVDIKNVSNTKKEIVIQSYPIGYASMKESAATEFIMTIDDQPRKPLAIELFCYNPWLNNTTYKQVK